MKKRKLSHLVAADASTSPSVEAIARLIGRQTSPGECITVILRDPQKRECSTSEGGRGRWSDGINIEISLIEEDRHYIIRSNFIDLHVAYTAWKGADDSSSGSPPSHQSPPALLIRHRSRPKGDSV